MDNTIEQECASVRVEGEKVCLGVATLLKRYSLPTDIDMGAIKSCDFELPVEHGDYSRTSIFLDQKIEVVVCVWNNATNTIMHNHGGSECRFIVIKGALLEESVDIRRDINLRPKSTRSILMGEGGSAYMDCPYTFHRITSREDENVVSVHVYSPAVSLFSEMLPTGQFICRSV